MPPTEDANNEIPHVEVLPTPIKGKSDWREYRAVRLANGVTALVIHDKESKTTGMSCVINAGASADPRSMSGLAHFAEHMCFLGSEKYSGENEYKRYLSAHGGRSNASTSMQLTNYKFEVLADHAEPAVDIFSNFFIAPLFTKSGTSREVQAVDSENSKNLTADNRRRLQILKDLADPNHAYSKFSTGNAQTLPTQDPNQLERIREALLAFHRHHYRPDNMTVVLAGPQSLDTLQEWIVSRYSQITSPTEATSGETDSSLAEIEQLIATAASEAPDNSLDAPPPPYQPAFAPEFQGGTWPVMLTTKPLRSMRKLVLMWPIPPSDRRTPDQSPSSLLSHLLGHEGPGSPFAVLQNQGWVSSLSAGPRTRAPDFTLFQVDLGLTEAGETKWEQVVDVIFAYCRLLQETTTSANSSDDLARIWGEMSKLDKLFFHQTSPGGVYSYAPNLAERVIAFGTKGVLSAGSMLEESATTFPLEKLQATFDYLKPSNCIVERCSEAAWDQALRTEGDTSNSEEKKENRVFGVKKEPWYGVEYHLSPIDSKTIYSWEGMSGETSTTGDLHLPRPNRYIPRTLDLCPDLPKEAKEGPRLDKPIDPPQLLVNDETGRLFYRLDDRYALPQSSLNLLVRNAAVQHTIVNDTDDQPYWEYDAKAALLSSVISGCFSEAMAQETYDADLAGLYWSLSLGSGGIRLSGFGFSDRLPDLAVTVLKRFLSGDFLKESYVESTKDRVIRGLRTYFESRRADSHAVYYRDALLASTDNGIDESLQYAEAIDLASVQNHFQSVLRNTDISLECLFSGNVAGEEAKAFYSEAFSTIQTAQLVTGNKGGSHTSGRKLIHPSGSIERKINPGEDIELHFASQNPQEENGAVICSYQSTIPAFKGDVISHPLALESTASIRLISHMLREPLFDDLRTKQQLGYIVSAYYELGYSSRPNDELASLGPVQTPVDFITIAILSRKLPPPEISQRIDDFLLGFRESLVTMPESEIRDHADALSTKLLKPIPKLQTEASSQFGKIQRYSPELFASSSSTSTKGMLLAGKPQDRLPWDSVQSMAHRIRSLTRAELVQTWDRLTHPSTRSRIVSCVYGNTYPLELNGPPGATTTTSTVRRKPPIARHSGRRPSIQVVNRFSDLLRLRNKLDVFDDRAHPMGRRGFSTWLVPGSDAAFSASPRQWGRLMGVVGCVLGVGVVGLAMVIRSGSAPDAGGIRRPVKR